MRFTVVGTALVLLCVLGFSCGQVIYDNALASNWADWSWSSPRNLANTAQHRGATGTSFSWAPKAWEAIYFHATSPVAVTSSQALQFYVLNPSTSRIDFSVVLNPNNSPLSTNLYTLVSSVPANTWTQVTYPFPSSLSTLYDIWLQDNSGLASRGVIYIDDMAIISTSSSSSPPTTPSTFTISINLANRQTTPISQLIYGANFVTEAMFSNVHYPFNRMGGNSMTRYNWEKGVSNKAADWFFMNIADDVASVTALPSGTAADTFVTLSKKYQSESLLTMNTIGYSTLDDRTKKWSFPVTAYSNQAQTECTATNGASWCTADAGNGHIKTSNTKILDSNAYKRTSKIVDTTYNTRWLTHLKSLSLLPNYVNLDNEPDLWHETHFDLFTSPLTYAQYWDVTQKNAAAIKANFPAIKIMGPVSWGWCGYFFSPADNCQNGADKAANGNIDFLEWYLKQAQQYQTTNGVRLIDILDIHYYPQASGVSLSSDESSATLVNRFNAAKSLYTSGYVDNSWINTQINLIPRLKSMVANRYPGTSIAISEYNFGNDNIASAALATAEVLAIFGREGLFAANIWTAPAAGSIGENAFKLFLNYDGAHSSVTGVSVSTISTNSDQVSGFAVYSASKLQLYVLLFNKQTTSQTLKVSLSGGSFGTNANRYSFSGQTSSFSPLASKGTVAIASSSFTVTLNVWEASLIVVPLTAVAAASSDSAAMSPVATSDHTGITIAASAGAAVFLVVIVIVAFVIIKKKKDEEGERA